MHKRWGFPAVIVGILACGDAVVDPTVTGQQYLFDISYRSTGFLFEWVGVVVLQDGSIVAYGRDAEWPAEASPTFSVDDLNERYASDRRVVGQVPPSELGKRLGQLMSVKRWYSSPGIACKDGGMVTYSGYVVDAETERYTQVVVREEGDRPRQNNSSAGAKLAVWLMELARQTDVELLSIFQDGFCVP